MLVVLGVVGAMLLEVSGVSLDWVLLGEGMLEEFPILVVGCSVVDPRLELDDDEA